MKLCKSAHAIQELGGAGRAAPHQRGGWELSHADHSREVEGCRQTGVGWQRLCAAPARVGAVGLGRGSTCEAFGCKACLFGGRAMGPWAAQQSTAVAITDGNDRWRATKSLGGNLVGAGPPRGRSRGACAERGWGKGRHDSCESLRAWGAARCLRIVCKEVRPWGPKAWLLEAFRSFQELTTTTRRPCWTTCR